MAEEQVIATCARCHDVDSREDTFVRQFAVELKFHITRTLELFENHFVHLRAGLGERRCDNGERAAVFDVAGCAEEAFGLLKSIGIDTTGKDFTRRGSYRIICACEARNRVEQNDNVVTAFDHTFCLFEHQSGNLDVAFGRFVERRRNYLGVDVSRHVGNFLRTLVDEQNEKICTGMVFGDGVCYIFEQHGFTGLRRCHDKSALTFTDGREHVDNASRDVASCCASGEVKLFVGEERHEMLEGYAVAHELRRAAVNRLNIAEREKFLAFLWRTNRTFDNVAGFESVLLDLCLRNVDVVGRRKVVIV